MNASTLKSRVQGQGRQLRELANVAAPGSHEAGRDSKVTSVTKDDARGWNKGWGKYGKT